MALATAHKWSKAVTGPSSFYMNHAGAQLQPQDRNKLEKAKDDLYQRPSTGRTSALGRRVEKPGESRPGGPSGQTDGVDHQQKHANK